MSQLAMLVTKLGHHLEETRVLALQSITSKLENGLITENDLCDRDKLFENLIKWFQFKHIPSKEDVLKLILRLLKQEGSEAGILLLKADPGLSCLREVPDCDILIQDIINITSKQVNSARYTIENKSLSKASKSYESDHHVSAKALVSRTVSKSTNTARTAKSKASTSREGKSTDEPTQAHLVNQRTFASWRETIEEGNKDLPSTRMNISPLHTEEKSTRSQSPRSEWGAEVIWSLPQVCVVASDLQLISRVETALGDVASVPPTCHHFTSIMIHDFPPEIFLQHPGVVIRLLQMARVGDVSSAVVECLLVYTQMLHNRLRFCSQLQFSSLKPQDQDSLSVSSEHDHTNSPDNPLKHEREGYLSRDSGHQGALTKPSEAWTIPQFCLTVLAVAAEVVGRVQQATPLALRALQLLRAVVPDLHQVWQDQDQGPHKGASLLTLSHALLDALALQWEQSVSHKTLVELHVVAISLHMVETLVPPRLAASVLPTKLQKIICVSLLDPVLVINYPALHSTAVSYATVLKHPGWEVYQDVSVVSEAMSATVKFSRQAAVLPVHEALALFRAALPALPVHQELSVVKEFIQYLMERWDMNNSEREEAISLTRSLLAHSERLVVSEVYRVVHGLVTSTLGPSLGALLDSDPCPRLWFLLNTSALLELVCHGVTHNENQVREDAEDILLHVVKCGLVVGERAWRRLLEQLSPVMPLMQCLANKISPLGRAVLQMLDPDVAPTADISSLQVLTGNIRLLFHKDAACRAEAASRLLWLTGLTDLPHKRLADVCLLDLALTAHTPVTGMYEVSSVVRVLELLSGPCVEARVKQSALTQLSVMTEDSRLHQVFMEQDGIPVFISILKHSVERMNEEVSGFIIPIMTTMKNLARHNCSARQTLGVDQEFLLCVLKSLFQLTEWRLQRDATQLLALLMYADFTLSSAATVSLPQVVTQSMCLPFPCQSHWTVSPSTTSSMKGVLLGNVAAERLLALRWAIMTQGMDSVLSLSDTSPEGPLALSLRSVRQVQQSHIAHNCRLLLRDFQEAGSHEAAAGALCELMSYLELSWLVDSDSLSVLPWRDTFRRFLLLPPSCQDDFALLLMVFKFLQGLLETCPGQCGWVTEALQTPPHTLLNLIVTASSPHVSSGQPETWMKVCLGILRLCHLCLKLGPADGWNVLVQLIISVDNDTQHFYRLALLHSKLSCLLAAGTQPSHSAMVWQLLRAFHCEAPLSFMGLSITRHTLLSLNKMLQRSEEWERWLREDMSWLPGLCLSRDVLVRASALQLFSGLARSVRGVATVFQVWLNMFDSILRIVVDHCEASIVREHAAILLTNILKNSSSSVAKEFAAAAQTLNLYQEFQQSVNLIAVSPVSAHIDASSGLLFTHPRFIRAGCWLIHNLLACSPDTLQHISTSCLPSVLVRTLLEVGRVSSEDHLMMLTAVCQLLTHCCCGCETIQLTELAPALLNFLDPLTFTLDCGEGMKRLWHETLGLLSVVLSRAESCGVLTDSAVDTLCLCLGDSALRLRALLSMPSLAGHLTPRDEATVCEVLVALWQSVAGRERTALLHALSALLRDSEPATETALRLGLLSLALTSLRQTHLTLTTTTSCTEKLNKNNPGMNQLAQGLLLMTSLLRGSEVVKRAAAGAGLADVVHKLWVWCQAEDGCQLLALDLLITFTADCPTAAQTLVLTSTLAGVGQLKTPSSHSLAHVLIALMTRESARLPPAVQGKVLTLLTHCCQAQECRLLMAKSALLVRWSDQWAARRPVSEDSELRWLRFIMVLTAFPEGQTSVPKAGELFEQLMKCAGTGRPSCRPLSFAVLRNLASHSANKPRFLSTKPCLSLLGEKLLSGTEEEKRDAALIAWSLAANHQKAKAELRRAGLVDRLRLAAATSTNPVFTFVQDLLKPR